MMIFLRQNLQKNISVSSGLSEKGVPTMKTNPIKSSMWTDPWVRKLSDRERLLWINILTTERSNIIGVYETCIDNLAYETGIPEEEIEVIMKKFTRDKKAYWYEDFVIIANRSKYNADSPKIDKGIINILDEIPSHIIEFCVSTNTLISKVIKKIYGIDTVSHLNLNSDSNKDSIQSNHHSKYDTPKWVKADSGSTDWDDGFLLIWKQIEEEYKINPADQEMLKGIADTEAGRGMIKDIFKACELKEDIKSKGKYLMASIMKNLMPKGKSR